LTTILYFVVRYAAWGDLILLLLNFFGFYPSQIRTVLALSQVQGNRVSGIFIVLLQSLLVALDSRSLPSLSKMI